MKEAVHKMIKRHQLLIPGDTVIVAVSGGPDSMALLHFLWSERTRYQIEVRACHLHHQLRGSEADEDAKYVESYCNERHIHLYLEKMNVSEYAKKQNIGTQLAARELRYQWFSELLSLVPTSRMATGHHGDDQVETIFMRMIRGGIPLHSFGIPVQRELGAGILIRPFLDITKEEIEHYCQEVSIHPRYDSSNQSKAYTRNRIRQDVLPIVKRENAMIHTHMQRQNEWADDDHRFLMTLAEKVLPSIIIKISDRNVTISRRAFLNEGVPLQRRLIHLLLRYLYKKKSSLITSIHIEQVLELLSRKNPSGEHHLSDSFYVRREYEVCHFSDVLISQSEERDQLLPIPGCISTSNWTVKSVVTDDIHFIEGYNQIVLDLKDIIEPLTVRSRQTGDNIACRGMEGTKKVGRLFIDRKISKQERESWPILVDGTGRILWVPLLHRTRHFNVDSYTQNKLVVSCYRQGQGSSDSVSSP